MTAVLAFLRIAWPYLLTAAAGGFISHEIDNIRYDGLQTKFATYQQRVAEEDALAQKAATDALQTEITARQSTEAHNAQVVSQLLQERDHAAADRDLAQRLLIAAQARPTSSRPAVPQAPGGRPAPAASPANSGGSLTEELAAAIDECRHNADQLDALIAEIKPQL
jgi:crotonobetainyl-CoA:carnitine CoA-transferase CaiB-like acyl-CoA transferase